MYSLTSLSISLSHHMLLFFISCFSFIIILLSNSLPLFNPIIFSSRKKLNFIRFAPAAGDEHSTLTLLDLPELTLECILERLPPAELCRMGAVCSDLRDRCGDNYFWERHMKQKWGRVVGDLARREWQLSQALRRSESILISNSWGSLFGRVCPFIFFRSSSPRCYRKLGNNRKSKNPLSPETEVSIMAQYAALETGQFWFPAQVHNRENGHAGFYLSCYDAHISYDSKTDTFRARYSSLPSQYVTTRMIEENISWSRIRAVAVDTPPYQLHISSDCLGELKPGDHIEIQWRKSDEFAYGWWYGVVGHDEDSCDGNEKHCQCLCSEMVTLEFKQYPANSRWRRTRISRKDHREEGNKEIGFYGGIRKLCTHEEISTWRTLNSAAHLL